MRLRVAAVAALRRRAIAFMFLGGTLLIPHLFPIVEPLSADGAFDVDLWISTSAHEALLGGLLQTLGRPNVRLRRAPGFMRLAGYEGGRNPPLPPKIPMLLRLAPRLCAARMVVC